MNHEELIHIHKEIGDAKKRIENIEKTVEDIKDNHLQDIWTAVEGIWGSMEFCFRDISNLRWWVLGSITLLGIVLAILEVCS